jgi:hypothetical protein
MFKKLVLCAVAACGLLAVFGEAQPVDARPRVRAYAGPYGAGVRWRGGRRAYRGFYGGGYYAGYGGGYYGGYAQPYGGVAYNNAVVAPYHGGTIVTGDACASCAPQQNVIPCAAQQDVIYNQ